MVRIDESRTAVKWTRGRAGRAVEAIGIHHWGADGQRHDNVVDFFCNPAKQPKAPKEGTSAHFVVSGGRVHCIVSPGDTAWATGVWEGNLRTINLELRPEATDADYRAAAELIRWLRAIYGDLPLRPHSHYIATLCPGRWDLSRLDREARGGTMTGMSPVPTGTRVTQEFGTNPGGYNPPGGHTGRDYGTWTGTYTVARAPGTVRWADWCYKLPGGPYGWQLRWFFDLAFGGIITVIDHDDGITTTYSHLEEAWLNPGDRVTRGQIIGVTGNTGSATSGDHLHYEALPRTPNWANGRYGRIAPGPYITEPYTSVTTQAGTVVATPGTSTGSGAAPAPRDLLEEIMATPAERRAFAKELAQALWGYVNPKVPAAKGRDAYWHLLNAPGAVLGYDVTRRGDGPQSGEDVNLATVIAYEQHNQVADRAAMQQILAQQALIMEHLGITTTENGA